MTLHERNLWKLWNKYLDSHWAFPETHSVFARTRWPMGVHTQQQGKNALLRQFHISYWSYQLLKTMEVWINAVISGSDRDKTNH